MNSRPQGIRLLLLAFPLAAAAECQTGGSAVDVINTRLAVRLPDPYGSGDRGVRTTDRASAIPVYEADQGGADLDGDGDARDVVLHWFEHATGATRLLEVAHEFEFVGNRLAFTAGQVQPRELRFYDPSIDTVLGSGLPASTLGAADGHLFFHVSEVQAGVDLNGDGDALDEKQTLDDRFVGVVHSWSPGGGVVNWGTAAGDDWGVLSGRRLSFTISEKLQGAVDRNGDQDAKDAIGALLDPHQGVLETGVAGPIIAYGATRAALVASEGQQGNQDLNGNGIVDFDLFTFRPQDGALVDLQTSILWGDGPGAHGRLLFWQNESAEGDLNGDGDANDSVASVLDLGSNTTTPLRLAIGGPMEIGRRFVAITVNELKQGTDYDGDGSLTRDILVFVDQETGVQTNSRLEAVDIHATGDGAYFLVHEDNGTGDLTGDGDTNDLALLHYDHASGVVHRMGLAVGGSPSLMPFGQYLWLDRNEDNQADLNGDGDMDDTVPHLLNLETGELANLGVARWWSAQIGENTAVFLAWEPGQGSTDLNGDGDALDAVAYVVRKR